MWSDKYGARGKMSASDRLETVHRRRSPRTSRWVAAVCTGLIGFLLMRAWLAPDPGILDSPPPEIVGTWVTDDPRYADRAFVISEGEFHLRVAPDEVLVSSVTSIHRSVQPEYDAYTITYLTPEGESVQELRVYPDGGVRLKNPPDVLWVRN